MANIALHVLDQAWVATGWRLGTLVRYCDDFVVVCPTKERAEAARDLAAGTLADLGLRGPTLDEAFLALTGQHASGRAAP